MIAPQDFTTVMLRTVLIPKTAQKLILASEFVDYFIRAAWLEAPWDDYPFPDIRRDAAESNAVLRLIRMGPGLLVYLDKLKKTSLSQAMGKCTLQS